MKNKERDSQPMRTSNKGSTSTYKLLSFALLIGLDGKVLASSYPALYPVSSSIVNALPEQAAAIRSALSGQVSSNVYDTVRQCVAFAVRPVLNKDNMCR